MGPAQESTPTPDAIREFFSMRATPSADPEIISLDSECYSHGVVNGYSSGFQAAVQEAIWGLTDLERQTFFDDYFDLTLHQLDRPYSTEALHRAIAYDELGLGKKLRCRLFAEVGFENGRTQYLSGENLDWPTYLDIPNWLLEIPEP